MAEFQTVIKQFKRLCNSADRDCSRCGLNGMGCSVADIVNNSIDFEKRVMDWAAEHLGPQYPSWGEFLCNIGLIHDCTESEEVVFRLFNNVIPAEIAQELGIEPVPIVHGDCGATNETDARKMLGLNLEAN